MEGDEFFLHGLQYYYVAERIPEYSKTELFTPNKHRPVIEKEIDMFY